MKSKHQQEMEIRGDMFVMGQATVFNKGERDLTDLETRCLAYLIRITPLGRYTLKQLFGEFWDDVKSKRSFGKRVGRVVDRNAFARLARREKNSSKSRIYEVLATQLQAANEDSALDAA